MDARLRPRGRRRTPLLCGILLLVVWAGTVARAEASEFQQVYDEAVRAQQAGNLETAAIKFEYASRVAPRNVDVLVRLALVRGHLQQYDLALQTVNRGLRIAPYNTDLKLARARILGWWGRYDEAERAVDAVIAEQPANAEALAIRGRIAFYQGHLDAAESRFNAALRLEPGNAEAAAGRADVARARTASAGGDAARSGEASPRWRIDAGYMHSRFSRLALKDWHEGFVRVEHRWPGGTALSGRIDASNRFGETETAVGAGILRRFRPGLYAYIDGLVAPEADFLPRWMVAAGGSVRVLGQQGAFGPLQFTADLRYKSYAVSDVQNLDPGIELYGFDGRIWLTGKWINAFDRNADARLAGWYGRVDWQAASILRLYGGFSDAPETEAGVTVDTRSAFGGASVDLTSSVRLNTDFAREDRENSYIRNVFGVSFTLQF